MNLKRNQTQKQEKENPNMKSLIRQHLVFINWPADLIVKSYDPRDLFHFSCQVHFLCCYVNGECRFSWSACCKNTVFSSSFQVDNSCFLLCLLRMSVMLLCHLGETSQCNNKEIQLSVHCIAKTNTRWNTNTNTYCLVVQSSAAVNACLRIPTGTSFNHSSVARGANNRPDKLFSSLSASPQFFLIIISHKYFVFNYHRSTTVKAIDLPRCTLLTFWDLFNLLRLRLTLASSREPPLTTTTIDPDRTCREYNSDRNTKRLHQDSWWPRQHYSTGWHSGVATKLTRYF